MRRRARHLLVVAVALAAVGCGSDDEPEGEGLPRATVSQLERRLDEIDRRYSDARANDNPGACNDIENDSFPAIGDLLGRLPDDVDPDVREATEDSFARLRELTVEGCSGVEPPQTETAPPETEVEPAPPPAPPPQTETTPPRTETVPQDEGEQDGGDEGGRGGGTGSGQDGGGVEAPQQGGEE